MGTNAFTDVLDEYQDAFELLDKVARLSRHGLDL